MLFNLSVAVVAVVSFSLAVWSGDAKDGDALQGVWLPSTAEIGSKMFPEEARKAMKLAIKDNQYTVTVGEAVDKGVIKVNPTAKPKEMDVTGTDGPNKDKTILAIYELDGDTLKVCYDLSGKSRPTEFKTRDAAQLFLVVYKREKP
jgi:uncharacterized protein (TIGR03067 family)